MGKKQASGFSIASVLVGMALLGLLGMALSQTMSSLFKATKSVDNKMGAQEFENLVRYALSNSDNCKTVMGLTGPTNPLTFATANLPGPTSTVKLNVPVPSITIAQKTYAVNGVDGNIKIDNLFIELGQPITPGSKNYVAPLKILTSSVGGGLGARQYVGSLNLNVTLAENGPNHSIIECGTSSSFDPKEICTSMGGTWLEGPRMTAPRCNIGPDIWLSQTEAPGLPLTAGNPATIPEKNGLVNWDGSPTSSLDVGPFANTRNGTRVSECYYQKGAGAVQVWRCAATWGNRAGYRCSFNPARNKWEVRYWTKPAGSLSYQRYLPNAAPWADCTHGVRASLQSPNETLLNYSDTISSAFAPIGSEGSLSSGAQNTSPASAISEGIPSYLSEIVRYSTVTRCRIQADADHWMTCKNNEAAVVSEGQAGACIYVRNRKIHSTYRGYWAKDGITIGGDPTLESKAAIVAQLDNYTGWLAVTSHPRSSYMANGSATVPFQVGEAQGWPCVEVELNTTTDPYNAAAYELIGAQTAPTADLIANPTDVAYCVAVGFAHEENANVAHYGTPLPASAKRAQAYRCGGAPDLGAAATPASKTARTVAGDCWYVHNLEMPAIVNYPNSTAIGVQTTNGATAAIRRYTGWVRFNGAYHGGQLEVDATTSGLRPSIANAATDFAAVPCNGGLIRTKAITP